MADYRFASHHLTETMQHLYGELQSSRLSLNQLATAAPFRQLAEAYVYGTFWKRHRVFIQETARNLDAEDLLAVALLALAHAFQAFDPGRGPSLVNYLTFSMYQACHQEVRRNYERAAWNVSAPMKIAIISADCDQLGEAIGEESLLDPATELERTVILDCVQRLPRLYRLVVTWHHFEGRSFEEIGRLLAPEKPVNKGTVSRQYTRALLVLRPELERLGLG